MIIKNISILILLMPLILSAQDKFPKPDGWQVIEKVDTYNRDNLWEYINGAAEQFHDYGFEELKTAELKSKKISAVVDVYNMGKSLNAFGIYMTERPRKGEYLQIGTEAVITLPSQGLLLKGPYYVKINFFDGKLTKKMGLALLEAIANDLPSAEAELKELSLLPVENRIPGSTFYTKSGYQGLSELKNCLAAEYECNDGKYQYFVIISESEQDAANIEESLSAKWKAMEIEGNHFLYRKIPYKGFAGIYLGPEGMIGVTDSPDKDTMISRLKNIIR